MKGAKQSASQKVSGEEARDVLMLRSLCARPDDIRKITGMSLATIKSILIGGNGWDQIRPLDETTSASLWEKFQNSLDRVRAESKSTKTKGI